jgi:hypothetical protein
MLRPFPQYSAVTDVYGNVASSNYHSLQLTAEKRRADDGLTVREIAPGVDLERDIRAQAEIPLHVAPNLKLMDAALFLDSPLGLTLPEKGHG